MRIQGAALLAKWVTMVDGVGQAVWSGLKNNRQVLVHLEILQALSYIVL